MSKTSPLELTNAPKPKAYSYIRFSSPEQAKGDSKRRQVEAAKTYAEENNLELDLSLKPDEGLSAFSGANIAKGHLGKFLKLVEDGKVERGSVLIIESFDRLSRQDVMTALELFLSIIRKGIRIVTLTDNRSYDQESIKKDSLELMMSIMVMTRANEDSETRSIRISAAWEKKRQNIHKKKLSAVCPEWLRLNKEKNEFEVIEERREVLQRIFDMSKSGMGQTSIAKTLNRENVETWGRGKRKGKVWHTSTINKILRNRSVIGEYEPHTQGKDRKRRPTGKIVSDYFPQVIAEQLFYEVQELRKARRIPKKGGSVNVTPSIKGSRLNNLFTGLVHCGYCGSTMRYQCKGNDPKKGGKYLACEKAINGKGCKYLAVRYEVFEEFVLKGIRDSDLLSAVLSTGNQNGKSELESKLSSKKGEMATIDKKLVNLLKAIEDADGSHEIVLNRISELESLRNSVEKQVRSLESQINGWVSPDREAKDLQTKIKKIFETLESLEGHDLLLFRSNLHQLLNKNLESITVYPRNKQVHVKQMEELIEAGCSLPLQLALCPQEEATNPWPKMVKDKPMVFSMKISRGFEKHFVKLKEILTTINIDSHEFKAIFGKLPNFG